MAKNNSPAQGADNLLKADVEGGPLPWKWAPPYLRWFAGSTAPAIFVWGALVAMLAIGFYWVWTYSLPIPMKDEWEWVAQAVGERPAGLSWLWEQYNEHRLFIPKAIYVAVTRMTGYSSVAMNALDVALLGAAAALLILGVRRLRGRTAYTDAFFPVLFLNWGHWENMIIPLGIGFVMPCFLTSVVVFVALSCKKMGPLKVAAWMGPSLIALCLCGAAGLPVVLLATPWLGWVGVGALRRKEGRNLTAGWLALALAAASYALLAFYFVDYHRPGHHPPTKFDADALTVAGQVLCVSLGEGAGRWWPELTYAVLGLIALTGAALLAALRRKPDERTRAVGLGLLLAAMVAVAVSIGVGRSGMGAPATTRIGLISRYVTTICNLLAIAYIVMELYAWRRIGLVVKLVLAAAVCSLLYYNMNSGLWLMKNRVIIAGQLRQDLQHQVPLPEIARRYASFLYWDSKEPLLEEGLGMLARARTSIFREVPPPDSRWDHMATLAKNLQAKNGGLVQLPDGRMCLVTVTPSRTFLPLAPTSKKVVVAYAIPPDAYTGGKQTGGVLFRVLLGYDGEADREVHARFLDPMTNPSDRREETQEISLAGPKHPTRLILETLASPARGGANEISIWSRVDVSE